MLHDSPLHEKRHSSPQSFEGSNLSKYLDENDSVDLTVIEQIILNFDLKPIISFTLVNKEQVTRYNKTAELNIVSWGLVLQLKF